MKIGDVYLVDFPYEENALRSKIRPAVCILISQKNDEFAAIKVTTKERDYDAFSIKIQDCHAAGLNVQSFVRCNKIDFFKQSDIISQLGSLADDDMRSVISGFNSYYAKLSELSSSAANYQTEKPKPELEMGWKN